ncbi:MAG: PQQ-dependent sugar dehydrogenase, partial [Methylococcales bacterium]
PNWGTYAPGHPGHLVIGDQVGKIWSLNITTHEQVLLLDVVDRLVTLGLAGPDSFDERGLLGVAFHPNFSTNGKLYTYTSEPENRVADFSNIEGIVNHQAVIAEWQMQEPAVSLSPINLNTRKELLRIDEPQSNHDGGAIVFGPDGLLYIALGDGGQADDQGDGHGASGNAMNNATPLGTILRIDVNGSDSLNGQYGIPESNPFLTDENALNEIFAYGFRNPFRMSFDNDTGDLIVADVGQNDIEEINFVIAGGNYGWNSREGSFQFNPNGDEPGFVSLITESGTTFQPPIAEYDHDEGVAIIGGFVNRGADANLLSGRYIFGDFSGRLFNLTESNTINEVQIENRLSGINENVLGFGEDLFGTLYVMTNSTGIPFGETGRVYKLVNAISDGSFEQLVQLIYIAFYGRPADPVGLDFWAQALALNGGDLSSMIDSFGSSKEFTDRFGILTRETIINNIFNQLFSRDAETAALAFYNRGTFSLQGIALDILNGAQRNDSQIVANKLTVAKHFTQKIEDESLVYNSSNLEEAVNILSAVNDNPQVGIDLIENGSTF